MAAALRRRWVLVALVALVASLLAVALAVSRAWACLNLPASKDEATDTAEASALSGGPAMAFGSSSPPPRWPVVCPPTAPDLAASMADSESDGSRIEDGVCTSPRPPRRSLARSVALGAAGGGRAIDAIVTVDHTTVRLVGMHESTADDAVDRDRYAQRLRMPFWCEFETGEIAWARGGPHDVYSHIVLRSCAIPTQAQAALDRGQPVAARFIPQYTPVDPATPWHRLQPHPFRCPASRRAALNGITPATPRFTPWPDRRTHLFRLAACTMVNSDVGLLEWLEYHRLVGYEHFFIYYHRQHDDERGLCRLAQRLTAHRRQNVVTLVDWPEFTVEEQPALAGNWVREQIMANNHCINRYGMLAEWMSVHDRDEYFQPLASFRTVPELLQSLVLLPNETHVAVRNWYFTVGPEELLPDAKGHAGGDGDRVSADGLVIADRVFRTSEANGMERPKLLFRPASIDLHAIHEIRAPTGAVRWLDPHVEMRMCHYKDGMPYHPAFVRDETMQPWVPRLRERLDAYS